MTSQPAPDPSTDPTLAVAERQLVQLRELAEMAMVAARAFTASAVAATEAEKTILGEEWFTPEVGRARACGAKDAAESIQKVTRAARLTMRLEMSVAEIVRDIRAGIVTHTALPYLQANAGENPGSEAGAGSGAPAERPESLRRSAGGLAGSCSDDRDSDATRSERDTDHLVDIERPDILARAPVKETVDGLCADFGATVDWKTWKIRPPGVETETPGPPPTAPSEARPPGIDLSP